jgi:hypothetical protein
MNGVGFAGSRQPCIPTSGSFGGPIARGVAGAKPGGIQNEPWQNQLKTGTDIA